MKRILFVDDEVRVLDGIRRLLYHLRAEWSMSFASSGPQALETMSRDMFDVIVTDIRMPGMDGIELLAKTRELYPGVVRIVLSGQSDRDLTLKSALNAHQYLSKPCDAESLTATIARAAALKGTFTDPSLQALVAGAGTLPSIPSVYVELMQQLSDADCCAQDIADIIARDPAMTAKILQLANSAFFGVRRRIASPKDAVLYLGLDTLKSLALTVKVFSQFAARPGSRFSIDSLAQHAMLAGTLARKIAMAEGASRQDVEDSFTAGLLHDLGKLLLVAAEPEKYEAALVGQGDSTQPMENRLPGESEEAEVGPAPHQELLTGDFRDAERRIFGTTHAEVGTYLVWLWGLPDTVVEAVAWHHAPALCPAPRFSPLTAVHVANALAHEGRGLDAEYLGGLGLADRVPVWQKLIEQATEELKAA